jgi:hypothetical protein
MITDAENIFYTIFHCNNLCFFKIGPPFWVRHFEFDKSDIKCVISDPETLIVHTA